MHYWAVTNASSGSVNNANVSKEATMQQHQQESQAAKKLAEARAPSVNIESLGAGLLGSVRLSAMDQCMRAQVQVCNISESKSSWAKREIAASHVAEQLSSKPTVPPNCDESDGCKWPSKHCSFKECTGNGAFATDDQLIAHLACKHDDLFMEAEAIAENEAYSALSTVVVQRGKEKSTQMCQGDGDCGCKARRLVNAKIDEPKEKQTQRKIVETADTKQVCDRNWLALYSAAITSIEQSKVPVVGCSIDRRAVDVTNERMHGDNLEAPICLFCARILTYDACDDTCGIKKRTLLNENRTMLGSMTADATEELVSVLTTAAEHGC